MAATAIADFSAIVARRSNFDIDLSNASLVEVLEAYQDYKRKAHPSFSLSSVLHNINIVQTMAGAVLLPEDVSDIFYSTFSVWLTNKGCNYNSQNYYCAVIRAALNWGIRHNCRVSSTFDQVDIPYYVPFTIALTPDEVSHIAHFDINTLPFRPQKKRTLEKVRDQFVLSCQLGQRFSDMSRITAENFNRNIFTCVQQKTGTRCAVDIDKFAMMPKHTFRLIKKYEGNAPFNGDISNFDKYLHELIKCIGGEFLEDIKIEHKVQGKIQVTTKKKFELVSSHTARRTFTTYNANRNIPVSDIMKATGHVTLSSFSKYIKFDN